MSRNSQEFRIGVLNFKYELKRSLNIQPNETLERLIESIDPNHTLFIHGISKSVLVGFLSQRFSMREVQVQGVQYDVRHCYRQAQCSFGPSLPRRRRMVEDY
jgi:hypothetical protein